MSQELKKFDPLADRVRQALAPMAQLKCIDQDSKDRTFDALRVIKGYQAEVGAVREAIKKPYLEAGRAIDARAKQVMEPLDEMAKTLNRELVAYNDKIRREQEAERRRLDDERRENDRKAKEALKTAQVIAPDAKSLADEQARIAADARTEQARIAQAKVGLNQEAVSGVRHNWKFRIKDPNAVKLDFRIPDETAIGKIVRSMGEKAVGIVGGIEVWDEPTVASGAAPVPRAAGRALR